MNVVWSPLALEKLETLAKFIALDKPSSAEEWVNDIFDRTELFSSQPEMGREVPELLGPSYREIVFGSCRRKSMTITDQFYHERQKARPDIFSHMRVRAARYFLKICIFIRGLIP
ncbi:MAG: hypothetical protein CL866_02525 [Cycloclasticus sp.]|nr:hypothetical protein [Cycloclasticus sp.]MBG95732.1 hypothetical protein [Cycloclasticus sp.]HAI97241.1 hypothetical protein [Methylococcaceae bacterium]